MIVNLLHLVDSPTGGWPTFAAHLFHALTAAGAEPRLYRVTKTTQATQRDFGRGLTYQNVSPTAAEGLVEREATVLTAVSKKSWELAAKLVSAGAVPVVHDPNELANPAIPDMLGGHRVVVIRPAMVPLLKEIQADVRFIPHPYQLSGVDVPPPAARPMHAVAICRVDFDKHIDEILDANAKLPPSHHVFLAGYENRQYAHFKLDIHYPDWRKWYIGPMAKDDLWAGARMAAQARYVVDLSRIPHEGGGTQYTTLEAWDAGARVILSKDWLTGVPEYDTVRGAVGFARGVDGLVALLASDNGWRKEWDAAATAGVNRLVTEHDPELVGKQWLQVLG